MLRFDTKDDVFIRQHGVVLFMSMSALILINITIGAVIYYISCPINEILAISLAVYVVVGSILIVMGIHFGDLIPIGNWILIVFFPSFIVSLWTFGILSHPKALIHSIGWIVGLLVLSVVFRILIDPYFIPILEHLPVPPPD